VNPDFLEFVKWTKLNSLEKESEAVRLFALASLGVACAPPRTFQATAQAKTYARISSARRFHDYLQHLRAKKGWLASHFRYPTAASTLPGVIIEFNEDFISTVRAVQSRSTRTFGLYARFALAPFLPP